MIRMEVTRVIITEMSDEQVVVLKEVGSERAFPIVVGIFEAAAIDRKLKNFRGQRPLTHDLIENILVALGATLEMVVITELRESTFYAKLVLNHNGKKVDVDSRPSDAIVMAIQMDAPIYVEESVLDEVANL